MALNFPSSPSNGDLYENYIYNSTAGAWQKLPGNTFADAAISDTPPVNPNNGDLWWSNDLTTGNKLSVYNGSSFVNTAPISNNAIINGDFGIWQRGTSITANSNVYTADRFLAACATSFSGLSRTVTRETFTPGDIEAIGYGDAEFYFRDTITTIGSAITPRIAYRVEDVRAFAGQKVTVSLWARSSTHTNLTISLVQAFGSGGSASVLLSFDAETISSNWQRITATVDVDSVVGKTIGSDSRLEIRLFNNQADGAVLDLWGVQLEAGPVATPFRLAGGGSKGAELALCQRYYSRDNAVDSYTAFATVSSQSTTTIRGSYRFPATMRITPSVSFSGNFQAPGLDNGPVTPTMARLNINGGDISIATTGQTFGRASTFRALNDTSAYIEMDAEL